MNPLACTLSLRCFTLIDNSSMEQIRSQDSNPNRANQQEMLFDVGLTSTISCIITQCSPQLYKVRHKQHSPGLHVGPYFEIVQWLVH